MVVKPNKFSERKLKQQRKSHLNYNVKNVKCLSHNHIQNLNMKQYDELTDEILNQNQRTMEDFVNDIHICFNYL